jgi:O-antigen/teichoic acid export membrane protein
MAAYGIPKMPGSLFQWGMSSVNRLLLTQYTTTAQIALYSIALKPGKLMDLAVSSFSLAWIPILMTNIDSPSFHGKLDKALRYYVFTVILFSAALTSYAPEIIRILAPAEYQSAAKMVGILSLRQAIRGLGYILSIGIVKSKKTYFDSISAGIGVAFTIGISLVLMPFIGIYGAIIADILGQTVHTGLIYYFSNRLKKISWQFSPIFFAIGGFLLLYLLTILFSFPNPYLDAIYRTTLFGLFILYVFVVVDRGVILKRIWQSITQNFRKQNLE